MAKATKEMCIYCFDVLIDQFENKRNVCTPSSILNENENYPLFVTWDIKDERSGEYDLRGCIGCLSPLPLHKIGEYAITSSMRDRRFNPVEPNEIPNLRCSVSLLTDYEHNKKWNDWVVGTHGIIIDFLVQGKKYNATYLSFSASAVLTVPSLVLRVSPNISTNALTFAAASVFDAIIFCCCLPCCFL